MLPYNALPHGDITLYCQNGHLLLEDVHVRVGASIDTLVVDGLAVVVIIGRLWYPLQYYWRATTVNVF